MSDMPAISPERVTLVSRPDEPLVEVRLDDTPIAVVVIPALRLQRPDDYDDYWRDVPRDSFMLCSWASPVEDGDFLRLHTALLPRSGRSNRRPDRRPWTGAPFNRDDAAFIIACHVSALPSWSSEGLDTNLAAARRLADDLGVRDDMERELYGLGSALARDAATPESQHPDRVYTEEHDGEQEPMTCPDCGRPSYWEEGDRGYHHAANPAEGCGLIGPDPERAEDRSHPLLAAAPPVPAPQPHGDRGA